MQTIGFYSVVIMVFFFFNDTATTEIYTYDTLFPYTTLFRSRSRRRHRDSTSEEKRDARHASAACREVRCFAAVDFRHLARARLAQAESVRGPENPTQPVLGRKGRIAKGVDRKSTRLNSSH